MGIRGKLIAGFMVSFLLLIAGVVVFFLSAMVPQIELLEREERLRHLVRVEQAIDNEMQRLHRHARGWGEWDNTYYYVRHGSVTYEDTHLSGDLVGRYKIDLFIIQDDQGHVIWSSQTDGTPLPDAQTLAQLSPAQPYGVVATSAGAVLMSSSPIVYTNGKGEPRGNVLLGRKVSDTLLDELSTQLQMPVYLSLASPTDATPQVEFNSSRTSRSVSYMSLLNDNSMMLEILLQEGRPFFNQVLKLSEYTVIVIFVLGALASLVAYLFLKKALIEPILALQRQAEAFGWSHQEWSFQPFDRNDELGQLSLSFVDMAKKINDSWGTLRKERNAMRDASFIDPLTHLKNRRYLEETLNNTAWDAAADWLFLIMDIDRFKDVNDKYGHDMGDKVLQQFADLIFKVSRQEDMAIRYGGEEFVLVCKFAGAQVGSSLAERLRVVVENHVFGTPETPLKVTCSVGFIAAEAEWMGSIQETWHKLLKLADLSLYAAKHSGRNAWVGLQAHGACPDTFPASASDIQALLDMGQLQLHTSLEENQPVNW